MSEEKFTALIVDDSQLISDRMEKQLMELDCISFTHKASSFIGAIVLLEEKDIDVAILDINLSAPGKNGVELLQFIKQNYPKVKTVMLTNQSDDYYRNLCTKLGSDHFMDKTVEFDNIPLIINQFFSENI